MENEIFIKQLELILEDYRHYSAQQYVLDRHLVVQSIVSRLHSAINRIAGRHSTYGEDTSVILSRYQSAINQVSPIVGVTNGLLADLNAGFLANVEELIHADMFSDYIEQARYLLEAKFKEPAAVIGGFTLEIHLRKLAGKFGQPVDDENSKPIKADTINQNLYKAKVFSKLEQKNIVVWLDIRNKAAHGKHDEYTAEDARYLIDNVASFIARNPA